MRRLNVWRVRRVLKTGGLTYDSSRKIMKRKGLDFVQYLRARRSAVDITNRNFISQAAKNKAWLRKEHFKRRRLGRLTVLRQEASGG